MAESRTNIPGDTLGWGSAPLNCMATVLEPQFVILENLKFNGVVDEEWTCNRVQIGITESAIGYTNGLHIAASSELRELWACTARTTSP